MVKQTEIIYVAIIWLSIPIYVRNAYIEMSIFGLYPEYSHGSLNDIN